MQHLPLTDDFLVIFKSKYLYIMDVKSCVPFAIKYVCRVKKQNNNNCSFEKLRHYFGHTKDQTLGFSERECVRYIKMEMKSVFKNFRKEKGINKLHPKHLLKQLETIKSQKYGEKKKMFLVFCFLKNNDKQHPNAAIDDFHHVLVVNFYDDQVYCSVQSVLDGIADDCFEGLLQVISIYSFY